MSGFNKKNNPEFEDMELIEGNVKVEWTYIGEGVSGDYEEDDLEDERLLRFYIYTRENESEDFVYVEDSSYCTNFPLESTEEEKRNGLEVLMQGVYEHASKGESLRKICQQLSHIGIGDRLEDLVKK